MERVIDNKDELIISMLKENANYSTRQLSKKTLLPATTIHNRIKKLKKLGVIKRFTVDLDYEQLGKGMLVYTLISANILALKEKKRTQYDIQKELKKFDFVERVDIVTGGTDIIAMIRVKDVKEYDNFLLTKIQLIEGISNTQSLMVIHS